MSKLYFCIDGTLRIRTQDEKHMFSVEFIQQQDKMSDLKFWAKWWNQPVAFEKNLTFSQFFQCIEPWLEFWGDYTQKDLRSYFLEMKQPTLVSDSLANIDWLTLDYRSELRPQVVYDENGESSDPEKIYPDKSWHLYSYYELTGYKQGEEGAILVDWTPLNQLANTPFVLNNTQIIMVDEFFINRYGKPEEHLLNPQGLGVQKISYKDDDEGQFSYLTGIKTHIIKDIIEGVFYRFDESPQVRDELDVQFLEQYEDELDDLSIPFLEEPNIGEMIELDAIYEEQRSILSNKFDNDNPYFINLLKEAKKSNNSHLRIGSIQEAKPLENRLLAWLKKE